jgi:hypothetical protein
MKYLLNRWDEDRGGHSYLRIVALVPLSSHTATGSRPSRASFTSQTNSGQAGRRFESNPIESPDATDEPPRQPPV